MRHVLPLRDVPIRECSGFAGTLQYRLRISCIAAAALDGLIPKLFPCDRYGASHLLEPARRPTKDRQQPTRALGTRSWQLKVGILRVHQDRACRH
jgi:hypothetical protein